MLCKKIKQPDGKAQTFCGTPVNIFKDLVLKLVFLKIIILNYKIIYNTNQWSQGLKANETFNVSCSETFRKLIPPFKVIQRQQILPTEHIIIIYTPGDRILGLTLVAHTSSSEHEQLFWLVGALKILWKHCTAGSFLIQWRL